jgi:hypothetical protein
MTLAVDMQFLGKNHKLVRHLLKASNKLSGCRSALEDMLYVADMKNYDSHVYYPGGDLETIRFEKGCSWTEVEALIWDSIRKVEAILVDIQPCVTLTSRAWRETTQAKLFLESAFTQVQMLRLKDHPEVHPSETGER